MRNEGQGKQRRSLLLIAEEDEDLWLVIQSALKDNRFEGGSYWVHDPAELHGYLDRLEKTEEVSPPDLIIMDFGFAERGGALLEIKSKPRLSSTPIVILVSPAAWDISFVTKPSSYPEWVGTMRQILDVHLAPSKPMPTP